jgi:hypothetical protein
MNSPHRCLVTVEAEADPQLPGRILDLLAVKNRLPDWFSVRWLDASTIRVSVELGGDDEEATSFFAKRILKMPTVLAVTRTWLRQRDQLAA